jgi:hypothetical protein
MAPDPPQAAAPKTVPAPVVAPVASMPVTATGKPPAAVAVAAPAASVAVASISPAAPATPPTPATPPVEPKSPAAPPESAAAKPNDPGVPARDAAGTPAPDVVAAIAPADTAEPDAPPAASVDVAVQRTEFGIDVGSARSVGGLRALWRGLLKSNQELASLRPIITVKEGNSGLGLQLRLVAGPLSDAAAAAKLCAALVESKRTCETTVFDGQRLAMQPEPAAIPAKPAAHKRAIGKRASNDDPPKKPDLPTFSSLFGKR